MRSPRTREIAAALRGAPVVLEEDAAEWASNVSASSTVATTTSLTSRLAALVLDLEDAAARKERDCEELGTFPEEEEEEEEVIEVSEEDVMRVLDAQEDPFQVGMDGWMGWLMHVMGILDLVGWFGRNEHHVCLFAGVL